MRKISLLALSLIFPTVVFAAAGTPDITFSGDGLVTARIRTGDFSGNSHPSSVVIQSDGKIVTAGYAREGGSDQFALARFTASGVLDPTFQGGTVITDLTECSDERIRGIALQEDGKIIVGGYCHLTSANKDRFVIARYKTNGTLDETFSTDGREIYDPGAAETLANWRINALTLQNGKILVAGYASPSDGRGPSGYLAGDRFVVARFTVEGVLDSSFGSGGYFIPLEPMGFSAEAHALAVQADGKVLVGGSFFSFPLLVRCADADCRSRDPNFGTSGGTLVSFENHFGIISDIAVQADGKIVAVGTALGVPPSGGAVSTSDLLAIRYDSSGVPDPTFGNGSNGAGVMITSVTGRWTVGGGVRIQPSDGKIILTGYSVSTSVSAGTTSSRTLEFTVRRLENSNGALDTTFGTGGVMTVESEHKTNAFAGISDLLSYPFQSLHDLVLQADGRIVVAGFSNDRTRDRFAVARVWDRSASDPEITLFTSNRDPVIKGADLTCTVYYKNRTGDLAQGVVITVQFSLAVELVAGDHGCGGQSLADGGVTVTCPRSDIATTDTGNELSFTVKPSVAGTLVATVQIGSAGHDITPSNSTRSLSVTVNETATDDDDDDEADDEDGVDDPPADEGDQTPQPPPEFRERRSFEIAADDPAVTGESGSGGGCSFVPDASTSKFPGLLWILLGSVPLFLVSLKELLRKKKT